ncbi:hypothetical protein PP613_23495 [Mycobacteroides abscessus]|nr:hypothetical protein [Mycobacteroides abscessus]MDM2412308.1 hypothetical protein [Mycobacteroides abscessus]
MNPLRAAGVVFGAGILLLSGPVPTSRADEFAPVAAPGMVVFVTGPDGGMRCTLGFPASTRDGRRLAVTAGHCGVERGAFVRDGRRRYLGRVIAMLSDDMRDRLYGYGVIAIANQTRMTSAITPTFGYEAVGAGSPGDVVCMFGTTSGRECGQVAQVGPDWVATTITADHGDSGGPIVRMTDRALLGIVVGGKGDVTTYAPLGVLEHRAGYAGFDHLAPVFTSR